MRLFAAILCVLLQTYAVYSFAEAPSKKRSAAERLFEWVGKKKWADFNPLTGRGAGDGRTTGSGYEGASANRGTDSTGAGDAAGKKIEFDDSKKTGADDSADKDAKENPDSDGPPGRTGDPAVSPPGAPSSSGGGAVPFEKWYPMCLFLDAYLSEADGNKAVKGVIDAAAKCRVNLVVFPVTVKSGSYAMDPSAINSAQQKACNIVGRLPGADRASTSICVDHNQMADKMCEQYIPKDLNKNGVIDGVAEEKAILKTETAGCAQMQNNGQENIEDLVKQQIHGKNQADTEAKQQARLADIKKHGATPFKGSGAAPSIEDREGCNFQTISHEAIGHSEFGHPNGKGDGFGIGIQEESGGMGDSWDEPGCTAMRLNAFPNTDKRWKWEANRQKYYTKPKDPKFQYDLTGGKPLFGDRKSSPQSSTPIADSSPPSAQGSPRVVTEDPPLSNKASSQTAPPATKGIQMDDAPDHERHKRKPDSDSPASSLVNSLRGSSDGDPDPHDPSPKPLPPPASLPVKGAARVGFDDSAPKNNRGGGGSPASKPRQSMQQDLSGESANPSGYSPDDDGDSDSGRTSSASAPPSAGSIATPGAAVGFDDNAPKNNGGGGSSAGKASRAGTSETTPGKSGGEANGSGEWSSGFGDGPSSPSGLSGNFDSDFMSKDRENERLRKEKASRVGPSKRRTSGDNTPRGAP